MQHLKEKNCFWKTSLLLPFPVLEREIFGCYRTLVDESFWTAIYVSRGKISGKYFILRNLDLFNQLRALNEKLLAFWKKHFGHLFITAFYVPRDSFKQNFFFEKRSNHLFGQSAQSFAFLENSRVFSENATFKDKRTVWGCLFLVKTFCISFKHWVSFCRPFAKNFWAQLL